MMIKKDSNIYIISVIDNLVGQFSNIKCRYEFDAFDNMHTIEVQPNSFYSFNNLFHSIILNEYEKFASMYPSEVLTFVNTDSLVPLEEENILYIKVGLTYNSKSSYSVKYKTRAVINPINIPSYFEIEDSKLLFDNLLLIKINNDRNLVKNFALDVDFMRSKESEITINEEDLDKNLAIAA